MSDDELRIETTDDEWIWDHGWIRVIVRGEALYKMVKSLTSLESFLPGGRPFFDFQSSRFFVDDKGIMNQVVTEAEEMRVVGYRPGANPCYVLGLYPFDPAIKGIPPREERDDELCALANGQCPVLSEGGVLRMGTPEMNSSE